MYTRLFTPYPFINKKDRTVAECVYQNEVDKIEVTEEYQKSLLPESGYMTVEEYEAKSRAKTRKDIAEELFVAYNAWAGGSSNYRNRCFILSSKISNAFFKNVVQK